MSEPTITFGAAEGFGALEGWSAQSNDSTDQYQRASVLDKNGNEAASKLHSRMQEVSTPYAAQAEAAPSLPATLGTLVGTMILTSISVSTTADGFASMTLSGHNHTTNAHAALLNSVAHGITLTSGFGVTDFLGGTAGDNASCISSSITISCQHRDEDSGSGDHLVGENYNAMMEATSEWIGVPGTASSGWDEVSVVTRTDNQGFLRTTVSGTKKLTLA